MQDRDFKAIRISTDLLSASADGNTSFVAGLITGGARGAALDCRNTDGCTPLILAAMNGHRDTVLTLISGGANVCARDNECNSALMIAFNSEQIDIAKDLIANHADLEARDCYGKTVLMQQVLAGNDDNVVMLVEAGANLAAKGEDGKTALDLARQKKLHNIADYLQETMSINNEYLLFYAANGHASVVLYYLEKGADPNFMDATKKTTLMWASDCGHEDVVNILIQGGADVNLQDQYGFTALMRAAYARHGDIVDTFIEEGANLSLRDKYGNTAYDWALKAERQDLALKIVYAYQKANLGFIQSCEKGDFDKAQQFLLRGANIEFRLKEGKNSAIIYAAMHNNLPAAQMLVDRGAALDTQNGDGDTALMVAAGNGNWELVYYLVSKGADLFKQNNDKKTAKDIAGSLEKKLVERFLEKKINELKRLPGQGITRFDGSSSAEAHIR